MKQGKAGILGKKERKTEKDDAKAERRTRQRHEEESRTIVMLKGMNKQKIMGAGGGEGRGREPKKALITALIRPYLRLIGAPSPPPPSPPAPMRKGEMNGREEAQDTYSKTGRFQGQ